MPHEGATDVTSIVFDRAAPATAAYCTGPRRPTTVKVATPVGPVSAMKLSSPATPCVEQHRIEDERRRLRLAAGRCIVARPHLDVAAVDGVVRTARARVVRAARRSATGKVLIAFAAPVRARSREVVAAINVAIAWSRVKISELVRGLAPTLKATANEISARVI